MDFDGLPVLGVGASLSFGIAPDPVALARASGGPDFIEYAGAAQHGPYIDQVAALRALGVPVLYHPSCLNLCGPWPNPKPWLDAIEAHVRAVGSAWLAQDVAVCFASEHPGYSIQLGYFVPPILTRASLEQAVARVSEVRAAVSVPMLLEPPPSTFRLGNMPMMAWLGELAERTDCGLLMDAGHVLSHTFLEGRDVLLDAPLERVVEVHVAGGQVIVRGDQRYYIDAHDLPVQPEVWSVFDRLLAGCPNLKAVCLECEGAAASLVTPLLAQVRQRVAFRAANTALRAALRERPPLPDAPPPRPRKTPATKAESEPAHAGYPGLVQLLLDGERRNQLASEPDALAQDLRLDAALLAGLDREGLSLDAEGRRRYLMSALCRGFPLTSAALGARPGGADKLASFLASPRVRGPLSARNIAFGEHLRWLLELSELPRRARTCLAALLEMEAGLVSAAATIRAAVRAGQSPPPPRRSDRRQRRRGTLALPPHLLLLELPTSPGLLRAALDQVTAESAWQKVATGALDPERLDAVLRAEPLPVTVLCRGLASGVAVQRAGAGGANPIIDVRWRTIELSGRLSRKVAAMAGERLGDLPPASQRLATSLLEADLLEIQTSMRR